MDSIVTGKVQAATEVKRFQLTGAIKRGPFSFLYAYIMYTTKNILIENTQVSQTVLPWLLFLKKKDSL